MADEFKKATQTPPEPPRFVAAWEIDMPALRDWLTEFYIVTVVQSGLLDPVYQQVVGQISFDSLPDPEATTIARAQATANEAWRELERFKNVVFGGSATISGTDTTASVAFDFELASTDYSVTVTPTNGSGSPSVDAFRIIVVTKGVGGLGFGVTGAPGVGNSVTYDYQVIGKVPDTTT